MAKGASDEELLAASDAIRAALLGAETEAFEALGAEVDW